MKLCLYGVLVLTEGGFACYTTLPVPNMCFWRLQCKENLSLPKRDDGYTVAVLPRAKAGF